MTDVHPIQPSGHAQRVYDDLHDLPPAEAVSRIDHAIDELVAARAKVLGGDFEETIATVRPTPAVAAGKAASQVLLDRLDRSPEPRLLSASQMADYVRKSRNWPAETARKKRLVRFEHAGGALYPAFQIDPETRTARAWVPEMVEILDDRGLDGRAFTLWAAASSDRFGGDPPVDHAGVEDFLVTAAGDLAEV